MITKDYDLHRKKVRALEGKFAAGILDRACFGFSEWRPIVDRRLFCLFSKTFFVSIFLTERTKSVFMDCKNAKVGNHLVVKKPGRQFPKFDFKTQIFLLRRLVARDGKSLIFYSPLLFNIRIIVINNNNNFFYYSSNNGSNEIEHKFKARRNFLQGRPSAEKNPLWNMSWMQLSVIWTTRNM